MSLERLRRSRQCSCKGRATKRDANNRKDTALKVNADVYCDSNTHTHMHARTHSYDESAHRSARQRGEHGWTCVQEGGREGGMGPRGDVRGKHCLFLSSRRRRLSSLSYRHSVLILQVTRRLQLCFRRSRTHWSHVVTPQARSLCQVSAFSDY